MKVFGPVPSRRLGQSLGINNIPPKACSYSCVYCQLGRTEKRTITRRRFHPFSEYFGKVLGRVARARHEGHSPDYLTFVADGEPTLDADLGKEIGVIRPLGVKIAVITNASLLWAKDVREHLKGADWVSVKVDAVQENIWRTINRSCEKLRLASILDGIMEFAGIFKGTLVTETMLVRGINDQDGHLKELAGFLSRVKPQKSYISVPIRPPAEKWVRPPAEKVLMRAVQILKGKTASMECLSGYEGDAFAGSFERDLLDIMSVHPMREEAVKKFFDRAQMDWSMMRRFIEEGRVIKKEYVGKRFYMRNILTKAGEN